MAIAGKDCRQAKSRMRIESREKCEEGGGDGGKGSRKGRRIEAHRRFIGFVARYRSAKPRHHKKRREIEARFKTVPKW